MQCFTIVSQNQLQLTDNTLENSKAIEESSQATMKASTRFLAFKNKIDAIDEAKKLGKGTTLYVLELDVKVSEVPDGATFYLKHKKAGNGITIMDFTKISECHLVPEKKTGSLISILKKGAIYLSGLASGILYADSRAVSHLVCKANLTAEHALVRSNSTLITYNLQADNCTVTREGLLTALTGFIPTASLTFENPWVFYGGTAALSLSALAIGAITYQVFFAANPKVQNYSELLEDEERHLETYRAHFQTDPNGKYEVLLTEFATLKDQATHRFDKTEARSPFCLDALFVTSYERRMFQRLFDASPKHRKTIIDELIQEAKNIREIAPLFSRSY